MADYIILTRPTNLRPGMLFFRGIIALAFSAICFSAPAATLYAFTILVGAFLFVDGIFSLFLQVASRRKDHPTFWPVLTGILGITAGVLTFVNPAATAWALSLLVAAWVTILGILEIIGAFELGSDVTVAKGVRFFLGLCGVIALGIGIAIFARPAIAGIALITFLGVNALLTGISCLILGWNIRRRSREIMPSDYFERENKRVA